MHFLGYCSLLWKFNLSISKPVSAGLVGPLTENLADKADIDQEYTHLVCAPPNGLTYWSFRTPSNITLSVLCASTQALTLCRLVVLTSWYSSLGLYRPEIF